MTRPPIPADNLLALLREHGPLTSKEIAALLKRSQHHTLALIRPLRRDGELVNTNQGPHTRWCLAWQYDAALAIGQRAMAQSRREDLRRRRRKWGSVDDAALEQWLVVEQRTVPAVECEPPKTRAVNSVFALAQIA